MEFRSWRKYRDLRGSLNTGMRVERGSAMLAMMYANVNYKDGPYKIFDFMPHEVEQPISLEQAMESWA
ncbi:phage tail assembly protein T [Pseudomonas syringae]|uniref:phage tail assembly protein T n=1 Tax=Pseudomonas syringae TaxID=317 RepID=UPI003F65002A